MSRMTGRKCHNLSPFQQKRYMPNNFRSGDIIKLSCFHAYHTKVKRRCFNFGTRYMYLMVLEKNGSDL